MIYSKYNNYKFILFLLYFIFSNKIISQVSFSPNNFPGLKLWLTGDSVLVTNPPFIDKCFDLSSSLNHAIQSSATDKPSIVLNGLNNHNLMSFDGLNDYLTFTGINDIRSVFWVVKENSTATSNYRYLLGNTFAYQHFMRGNNKEIWNTYDESGFRLTGTTKLNHTQIDGTITNLPSSFCILSLVSSGNMKADAFTTDRLNPGRVWDGSLAELIIFNQPLTSTQVDSIENYLHNKYAPKLNLGENITTCYLPYTIRAKKDYFKNYLWQDGSITDSLVVNTPGIYYLSTTDIFNRTSTDTLTVTQAPANYSVALSNDTSICSGDMVILNAGPKYLGYNWSNGLSTNTISVNSTSNLTVSVVDCSGNTSIDSIKININPKPYFNFGGSDSIVCYNSNYVLDPNFINSLPLTFNWNDNTHDSIHPITHGGKYFLNVLDNLGCSFSDTITLHIDSSLYSISLGPDLSLCAGNSISLISGSAPSLTYTWNTGSNNDSLFINTSGQYSVIVTNTNNCVAKDTINVTITGLAPVANFTSSIGCKNNAVSFTDLSIPPSGNTINSYLWNFGDALSASNTSTLSNPFHTFTDTGYYSVKLKIITNVGCEQSITKAIHISPKPTINFTAGLSCQNDSTSFFSSTTNPVNYNISSLKWNFGDPSSGVANTSTISAPKHLFSNATNYTITLIATNNAGCKDSLRNIIAVKSQVKANFTYSSACTNTTTIFQDNSIVPSPNTTNIRSWNFGTSTASGLTVFKNYTNPGVYSVTLSVTGNNGCNSSNTKIITVFDPPIASFIASPFCAKDTITVLNTSTAQSGIISSNIWKLNNTYFSSIPSPSLSIFTAGSFPLKLTVTNSFGCKDSVSNNVTVYPLPNIDFTTNPSSYYYVNSPVSFVPNITNASSYLWNIAGITSTTIQSPSSTFSSTGTYSVSLFVKDQQGCKNSVTKNLLVTKRFLDVAVLNVVSSKDNDGFMSVQTDIANYGTIPASNLELNYHVSDGGNIKETWTGNLIPNAVFTYTFSSKTATQINSTNNITCVDIKKVNSTTDENIDNNTLCSSLNTDAISVSNPIPNPTNSDISLPIILNKDMDITISIYNTTGQLISKEIIQKGITGLNFITLPSSNYARGCYIIKTVIDDKIFIKKFIKISNE